LGRGFRAGEPGAFLHEGQDKRPGIGWRTENKAEAKPGNRRHTWDAGGNLLSRYDVNAGETETFTCDFLDRLTGVSGPYSHTYSYNAIGNILSMNGGSYTYGARPHAVTAVGSTSYSYDANGNMISRGGTAITWDAENRPTVIGNATFVYDGDGSRAMKTEGGQTTVYVNRYYEKNLTTGVVTTYYYLGDRLVALRNGSSVYYVHLDQLGGTSVVTNASGAVAGSIKYYPYGSTRSSSGSLYTDKKFTGQRLDATGLYYYGARYYDPTIGRFISGDPLVPKPSDPQSLNRYSYCRDNPLTGIDPLGLFTEDELEAAGIYEDDQGMTVELWDLLLEADFGDEIYWSNGIEQRRYRLVSYMVEAESTRGQGHMAPTSGGTIGIGLYEEGVGAIRSAGDLDSCNMRGQMRFADPTGDSTKFGEDPVFVNPYLSTWEEMAPWVPKVVGGLSVAVGSWMICDAVVQEAVATYGTLPYGVGGVLLLPRTVPQAYGGYWLVGYGLSQFNIQIPRTPPFLRLPGL